MSATDTYAMPKTLILMAVNAIQASDLGRRTSDSNYCKAQTNFLLEKGRPLPRTASFKDGDLVTLPVVTIDEREGCS